MNIFRSSPENRRQSPSSEAQSNGKKNKNLLSRWTIGGWPIADMRETAEHPEVIQEDEDTASDHEHVAATTR